jgi:hypothetical protein
MVAEPEVATAPVHEPVHAVALLEDQVSVVEPSTGTDVAELEIIIVGGAIPPDEDPPPQPLRAPSATTAKIEYRNSHGMEVIPFNSGAV